MSMDRQDLHGVTRVRRVKRVRPGKRRGVRLLEPPGSQNDDDDPNWEIVRSAVSSSKSPKQTKEQKQQELVKLSLKRFLAGPWRRYIQIQISPTTGERCMMSEDGGKFTSKIYTGGLCGISNYGNNCFFSAGIQCLAHLEPVVCYFLSGEYSNDLYLSESNFLGSKNCEVTKGFARIVQQIWATDCVGANGDDSHIPHVNDEVTRDDRRNSPRKKLNNFRVPTIDPKRYLRKLSVHKEDLFERNFDDQEEQCCAEWVRYLLDMLNEDLNHVYYTTLSFQFFCFALIPNVETKITLRCQ